MVLLSGAVSPAIPGLLRDRLFRRYWAASSVSMLGDGLTSLAIPLMARRLGLGRALLIGSVTVSAPLLAVPAVTGLSPAPAACVFLALLGSGFGRAVQNVAVGSVFALSAPDALRSRVRGAFQTVSFGSRAAGALLGGTLGAAVGLRPALCAGAAGGLLVLLWLLPSPLLGLRMPEA